MKVKENKKAKYEVTIKRVKKMYVKERKKKERKKKERKK